MKKRILSLLLILCMAVTLLPTAVFAEDATGKLIPAGGAKIGETVYQTLEAAVTARQAETPSNWARVNTRCTRRALRQRGKI